MKFMTCIVRCILNLLPKFSSHSKGDIFWSQRLCPQLSHLSSGLIRDEIRTKTPSNQKHHYDDSAKVVEVKSYRAKPLTISGGLLRLVQISLTIFQHSSVGSDVLRTFENFIPHFWAYAFMPLESLCVVFRCPGPFISYYLGHSPICRFFFEEVRFLYCVCTIDEW